MPDFFHGDVRIAYALDGPDDAPTLVLSNSLGTTMDMWAPQMPLLTQSFRVLRYDMRGHGASDVPPGPYTVATLGRDVVALLRHVECARAHFCGLSMSGLVGLWLALNDPGFVDRLVLANTAARIGPSDIWTARIARIEAEGMPTVADAVVQRWFMPAFIAAQSPAFISARQMLRDSPAAGYMAACAAVRDADFRDDLGRIAKPTLVVAGKHDMAATPADGRFMAERIAGARYVELDASHLSNLERPAEFTQALVDFLT
jgi:3-oxoadipate enol-lactonase